LWHSAEFIKQARNPQSGEMLFKLDEMTGKIFYLGLQQKPMQSYLLCMHAFSYSVHSPFQKSCHKNASCTALVSEPEREVLESSRCCAWQVALLCAYSALSLPFLQSARSSSVNNILDITHVSI
jgi:hypothetical protein